MTVPLGAVTSPSPSWRSEIGYDTDVIIAVVLFIFNIFLLTDLFLFTSEIFLLREKKYTAPLYFPILKITRCRAGSMRKLKTSAGDLRTARARGGDAVAQAIPPQLLGS